MELHPAMHGDMVHWCHKGAAMSRLTITLSDERYLALKEAAVRQHKSIREIIENSLDFYGIKSKKTASDYVAMARKNSALNEEDALELAVQEMHASRRA